MMAAAKDIMDHPMWATQVELERGMRYEGIERVNEGVTKVVEKHQKSKLQPMQDLMQAWLPPIAEDIKAWVKQASRQRGTVPVALEPLKQCDPYVAALLALRTILDGNGRQLSITPVAIAIGGLIEHELQIRLWEAQAPKLFHAQQSKLRQQGADPTHTKRVNIHQFNALLKSGISPGLNWVAWDDHKRLHVGSTLMDAIIRATGWFETHEVGTRTKGHAALTLMFKPGLDEWITNQLGKLAECSPALTPTVVPPKRWTGMASGGYYTPCIKGPELIRFHAYQADQQGHARDEYDALDMPKVYSALHSLQETPWRTNKRVLEVIHAAIERHMVLANLPRYQGLELPVEPVFIVERRLSHSLGGTVHKRELSPNEEQASKQWRRETSRIRGINARSVADTMTFNRMIGIADRYQHFDRFYFPHKLDWRGRMYPIPVLLQPQGNDVARGLLEFADGKPITEANGGAGWLAVNLTSAWGNDKVSFQDRVDWVYANEQKWRSITADPLGNLEWAEVASKPWQALAAIFDWVAMLDHGYGYVSHAAVAIDGTCNGIQHLSAMTRDAIAGSHVNLTNASAPKDIYTFVGDTMLPDLWRIAEQRGEQGDYAAYWLTFLDAKGHLPRALTKRPVMVLPYGASRQAFFKYIGEWLDEVDPLVVDGDADASALWALRYRRLHFLTQLMVDAVGAAVPGAVTVMKWLKDCAEKAAVGNQPIYWIVPDGFVVRSFYGKMVAKRVRVKLDGSSVLLRVDEPTKDLDKERQLLGISPNFTHSLDACAARTCINMATAEGEVTHFTCVHDAFGTHAADLWRLAAHTRQAFVDVHQADVLVNFREACKSVMIAEMVAHKGLDPLEASEVAEERLPAVLPMGALRLEDVLESDYFFA